MRNTNRMKNEQHHIFFFFSYEQGDLTLNTDELASFQKQLYFYSTWWSNNTNISQRAKIMMRRNEEILEIFQMEKFSMETQGHIIAKI